MVRGVEEANRTADRIQNVAKKFLDVDLEYLGYIPLDPMLERAIHQRKAASEKSVHTVSGQAWTKIAHEIASGFDIRDKTRDLGGIWRELFWLRQEGINLGAAV